MSVMFHPAVEHSISSAIKDHVLALSGTAVAWVAVVTANQAQFEYWMRIGSLFLAMVASSVTIWSIWRKRNR